MLAPGALGLALDIHGVEGHKPGHEDEVIVRKPSDSEPLSALAFKIMSDPHLGKLTYVRIYSGVLESGTQVLNTVKDRKERPRGFPGGDGRCPGWRISSR